MSRSNTYISAPKHEIGNCLALASPPTCSPAEVGFMLTHDHSRRLRIYVREHCEDTTELKWRMSWYQWNDISLICYPSWHTSYGLFEALMVSLWHMVVGAN